MVDYDTVQRLCTANEGLQNGAAFGHEGQS